MSDNVEYYNRATKYLLAGNPSKALSFYKKQLRVAPPFKELYLNMANCYKHSGDDLLAMKMYNMSADVSVPFVDGTLGPYSLALNNIGLQYYSNGDDLTAIEYYKQALELDPLYGEAIWNYSIAELRRTDCKSLYGWQMYAYRFKRGAGSVKMDMSTPFWDGDLKGPKLPEIYVIAEQGLGDKIMFGRYLHLLKPYFTTIKVVCHESLDCFYTGYECVRVGDSTSLAIPMGALAAIFLKSTVDPEWLVGKFTKADITSSRLKIGVVWSGSETHANNRNRSCSPTYFKALSKYGDLYSLNPSDREIAGITKLPIKSWTDTASYTLAMDVVVSVDTSVVHLAGSLGVPTIMVQPLKETDFRWGNTGLGATQTWYKSVRVLHNPNSWDATFKNVESILCTL